MIPLQGEGAGRRHDD